MGQTRCLLLTEAGLAEGLECIIKSIKKETRLRRELRAFFATQSRQKRGGLSDYGAGVPVPALFRKLRAQGWIVYAYEHSYLLPLTQLSSRLVCLLLPEQLQLMRFDGIFSNNVLEHFRLLFRSCNECERLLHEGGKHGTRKHMFFEFTSMSTRGFNLHFSFTGKSKRSFLMQTG